MQKGIGHVVFCWTSKNITNNKYRVVCDYCDIMPRVITHIICSYSGLSQWRTSQGDSDSRKLTNKKDLYQEPKITSPLSL